MNRPRLSSHERYLAAVVSAVAVIAFAPALHCGFVPLDDGGYVSGNPLVRAGLSPAGIDYAFRSVVLANWAPLTILSYQLDASIFGPAPWGFHLTNILLHAAAAGLLALGLGRMTGRPDLAAAAALLWAVHPLRVDSVAWVSERKDVLSTFFLALVLVLYERYARRPNGSGMAVVAAAMGAGLLAKVSLVTLPVLLLILDVWPLGRVAPTDSPWDPKTGVARYPSRSHGLLIGENGRFSP